MSNEPAPARRPHAPLWIAFFVVAVLISAFAVIRFRAHADDLTDRVHAELVAIARLKASSLVEWRAERKSDLSYLARHPRVVGTLSAIKRSGSDRGAAAASLLDVIDPMRANHPEYESVVVVDAQGVELVRSGALTSPPLPLLPAVASEAVRLSRIEAVGVPPQLRLDAEIPVLGPDDEPVGAVRLRIDPTGLLAALMEPYSVGYRHAVELLRRDRVTETIVRIGQDDPPTLQWQPVQSGTVEGRAFDAAGSLLDGVDEDGGESLAVGWPVPERPWMVLVRAPRHEALAGRRDRLRAAVVEALLALLIVGMAILWLERRSAAEQYRSDLHAELGRSALHERYAHLFRSSNDGILIHDEELRVVDANERALATYGYSLDELRGLRACDLRPSGVEDAFGVPIAQLWAPDGAIFESRHQRRDGSVFDVEVSARPFLEGRRRLLQCVVRDVSERRRQERELEEARRALAESQTRLASIIASARDAIVLVEQDGRIGLCNEAAAAIVGLPAAQVIGRSIFELLPPAMHALVRPRLGLDDSGQGGGMLELVFRRTDDGSDGAIEASFSPQEAGGRRSCTIIFRDLSARRRAEERNRILARLVEQSSNLFVVTDTSGAITYVNPRFEAVTGWTLDEVRGKTPRVLRSGHTPRPVYEELWRTVLSGAQWRGELVNHTRSGGQYRAKVTIAPILDDSGQVTHLAGIQEDITEQRRLEQEFQQAQKLETLGMVTGGVAHDFNNMLSAILGYAELAADSLPAGSAPREDIEEVRTICGRAAGLTRQLLAFSRRQAIVPQNVDLNALLMNLFKMLRRLVGENIELVVLPADEPAWIRADAGQIEQVVMNLAVNARDAMPGGGKLRVEAHHVRLGPGARRAPAGIVDGSYVSLRVIDSGTGMTAETMEHLFEPFFTTKEKGRGTGLGLATTFGIVKQSGGHIGAETVLGAGSTFEVLLPSITVAEEAVAAAQRRVPVEEPHDERVLLVEDDEQVRSMLRRALARAGYRVTEAAHGEEALRILDAEGPCAFALVLTDLVMPRLGGAELAEEARRRNPAMRVLFMSGYADDIAMRGGVLESSNFVPKPFTPAAILERVRAALRQEPPRA